MTDWPIVILTGALVAITGYYAWQNKRMADHNARMVDEMRRQRELGIYGRRVAVLRGIRRALSYTFRDANVPGETIATFLRAMREKEFLFGKELCDYLDELYRVCVRVYALHASLEGVEKGDRRSTIVAEHAKLLAWLHDQSTRLSEKFRPYLTVSEGEARRDG